MKRFTDSKGNIYKVDSCQNLFKNNKCINTTENVAEHTKNFLSQSDLTSLSFSIGHVSTFEYGGGDNKVIVTTGKKDW